MCKSTQLRPDVFLEKLARLEWPRSMAEAQKICDEFGDEDWRPRDLNGWGVEFFENPHSSLEYPLITQDVWQKNAMK